MTRKKSPPKKRIFLVEDHAIMRQGLKLFIGQEPDMVVCGEACTAVEAFAKIPDARPDAIVTDISLSGMNGIEFLKNVKALYPEIAAVVLSMHDESLYAVRALRAGALGYVMKKESAGEVIVALRKAFLGKQHVSEKVVGQILRKAFGNHLPAKGESPSPAEVLSDRELEVYEHIGCGEDTNTIAKAMGVSPKTVETHRMHIKEKLGISSLPQLIRQAAVWADLSGGE